MSKQLPESGIVTSHDWLLCSDGDRYVYLFCEHWRVVTDDKVPLEHFHSRERWSLFAEDKQGKIIALIPGCGVAGFIAAKLCPKKTICVPHKEDEPDVPPGIFNLTIGKGYR